MRLTNKLLGYLNRVFNRDPQQFLALRLSYAGGMTWRVRDAVLTTAVTGGPGAALQVDLRGHTIASLVAFLAAQPGYSVVYQVGSAQSSLGARVIMDGANDIDTSNGDHFYAHTSPLWAYLEAASEELTGARRAIAQMLRQMSTRTAEGEWLDEIGGYYNVPRLPMELDERYSSRIITEVLRPRMNNVALEIAIADFTGQVAKVTNVITYSGTTQTFSGANNFSGDPYFYNASAAPKYGLFDVEYGYDLLNGASPADFGVQVRALVGRLRAAGTQLRALNLIGGRIVDTFSEPTEAMALSLTAVIEETLPAPSEGDLQVGVVMDPVSDSVGGGDDGVGLTLYYGQAYSGLRRFDGSVTYKGGTTVKEWLGDNPPDGFPFLPSLGLSMLGGELDPRVTFNRAGVATRINAQGQFETVAAGVPRFHYSAATRACLGLLIEEQRTNLLPSNNVSSAWFTNGTDNVELPGYFAGLNGTRLVQDGTLGDSPNMRAPAGVLPAAGAMLTGSVLVDLASARGATSVSVMVLGFDTDGYHAVRMNRAIGLDGTGTTVGAVSTSTHSNVSPVNASFVSTTTENLYGSVWRISVTGTLSKASTSPPRVYAFANGPSLPSVVMGAAQLEYGSAPTSIIPTTNGIATRSAENAHILVSNFGYTPAQGTLFAQGRCIAAPVDAAVRMLASLYPASGDAAIRLEQLNLLDRLVGLRSDAGLYVTQGAGWQPGEVKRMAAYYDSATLGLMVNGVQGGTPSPVGPVTNAVRLGIGTDGFGFNNFNGLVQRIAFYPRMLATEELQALTL